MRTTYLYLLLTCFLLTGCATGGYNPTYIISDGIEEELKIEAPAELEIQAR